MHPAAVRRSAIVFAVLLALPLAATALLAPAAASRAPVDAELLARAAATPLAPADALVSVASVAEAAPRLRALGLDVLRAYPDFGVLYVAGPAARVVAAADVSGVQYVAADAPLPLAMETASIATNARAAWDDRTTSTSPILVGGQPLDGRGIGVAVIDSGIDGTHPDLAPALASNKRWVCPTPSFAEATTGHKKCLGAWLLDRLDPTCDDAAWTSLPNTDTIGHGTHVAGIIAGRGVESDGRFRGVAPGATLYGLGASEGASVLWAVEALAWVNCHHASVTPAIRIVSNSWGGEGAFNPNAPINKAVTTLVGKGLVVAFATGNEGAGTVSQWAKNPAPGVLAVANYDDLGTGTRAGVINPSSSACLASNPAGECPDVAAPGTDIIAAAAKVGALPAPGTALAYMPYYAYASGTSMATPHVSGVVALLLQANPALTPADIEDILEDTAVKFPSAGPYSIVDPTNPTGGVSPLAGHGLVDALAALHHPRVGASGGSAIARVGGSPHVYTPVADPQLVAGVQWTVVAGAEATLAMRSLESGDPVTWPLANGQLCRFRVEPAAGPVVTLPCQLAPDSSGRRMEADHTFAPGTYRVEPQIDFGSGFVAVDSFVVRAK